MLTNILDILEEIYDKLDEGKAFDVIYLDFAKAFDKVLHARLTAKLQVSGIRGKVFCWIKNWLLNKRQIKIGIRGKYSDWAEVISGVPQGSVLYINDIDGDIMSKISTFADGTKLYGQNDSEAEAKILQQDLNRLSQWSAER